MFNVYAVPLTHPLLYTCLERVISVGIERPKVQGGGGERGGKGGKGGGGG
jgi:hypothetical protein